MTWSTMQGFITQKRVCKLNWAMNKITCVILYYFTSSSTN